MKIAVIGAGITGLTTALRLGEQGHQITVYEQASIAGGLGSPVPVGSTSLERFYHHFFRSDRHVIDLIQELGIGDKLHFHPSKTSVFSGTKLYPFSTPFDLLRFRALPWIDRLRLGFALFQLKYLPQNMSMLDQVSAETWLRSHAGTKAYNLLWKPLLVGKFAKYASQIPAAWLRDRIRDRSYDLGYLDGGAETLFNAFLSRVKKYGVRVQYNTTITSVESKKNQVTISKGLKQYSFDACLITATSPIARKLIQSPLPETKTKILDAQDQLGAVCLLLELSQPIQKQYWINICNVNSPVLVMVEHTNLIPAKQYQGRHLVYLANYIHRTDPNYRLSDEEVIDKYTSVLKKLNPRFSKRWILKATVSRAPRAQTIFGLGSLRTRPPHRLTHNLFLGNIDQMYPHDRNFNLGVEMGAKLAQRMVK